MVNLIPPVRAECYMDVSDQQILEIIFKLVLFSMLIYVIYKIIRFVMSYVNINKLAEIQSNFGFPTTLLLDKTDLYLQFVNTESVVNVNLKIGSIFGYPEDLSVEGVLQRKSFTSDKQIVYDFLEINWEDCKISLNNLDLQLPHVCQIPLTTKFFLRTLCQNHKTMYRVIACQASSRKVMVILPLCDLYKYEIEVVSTSEVSEEGFAEQTMDAQYAKMNGMDGLELSEIKAN